MRLTTLFSAPVGLCLSTKRLVVINTTHVKMTPTSSQPLPFITTMAACKEKKMKLVQSGDKRRLCNIFVVWVVELSLFTDLFLFIAYFVRRITLDRHHPCTYALLQLLALCTGLTSLFLPNKVKLLDFCSVKKFFRIQQYISHTFFWLPCRSFFVSVKLFFLRRQQY